MNRWMEVPAKAVDPIVRLAACRQVFVMVAGAGVGSHVEFIFVRPLIKNGGVIAAMKVGVCFYIKVLGKKPAAITQSNGKKVGRTRAAARPGLVPRLQPCYQAEAKRQKQSGNEWSTTSRHSDQFTGLRLKTTHAPNRNRPA